MHFKSRCVNKTIAACAMLACASCVFYSNSTLAQSAEPASPGAPVHARAGWADPGNRVSLSASASVEVRQDWMSLNLSTTRDGSDAAAVQAQLRNALDAALAVAKPQAEKDRMELRTGSFSLSPRYGRDGKINGWQGSVELTLEGRDFERITATAGKVNSLTLNGIHFGLSPKARTALESDLQAQAIERFKTKAKEIAAAFGMGGYQIMQVDVGAVDGGAEAGHRPMLMMAARSGMADAAPPVPAEPGRTTVQLSVSGPIRLK